MSENRKSSSSIRGSSKSNFYRPSTYERAKSWTVRITGLVQKMKESEISEISRTKAIEKTVRKFLYYSKSYKERCS